MAKQPNFQRLAIIDVPKSRDGKHKRIVSKILSSLNSLQDGSAIKVPLADLGGSKANVRSALNRATRKARLRVATATDEKFLYIWNVNRKEKSA
jgi:hypothetical protein